MHESIVSGLNNLGYEVDYLPEIDKTEIEKILPDYTGLIVRSKIFVNAGILKNAPKLKFIARAGAGIDNLDTYEIEKRNIAIINAPEGNRDTLAEHAIGMLLCLLNNLHKADREVKAKIWDREGNRGEELMGKVVGLIGYGNMGEAFAQRLKAFGVEILAYDKYKRNFADGIVKESTLEEVFERANILSLHVPLTTETRGWINAEFFNKFKNPIYVVNTARGEILSLKALKYCLDKKIILGAALDVLEKEKFSQYTPEEIVMFDQLADHPNIIFAPHIAGWSYQSYVRISEVLVKKIEKIAK